MSHQFTIKFTEELAKYAARRFFVRQVGISMPFICLLLGGFLLKCFVDGERDWEVGVGLAVVGMGLLVYVTVYFTAINSKLAQLRKMESPTVSYELDDQLLKTTSNLGSTELKWKAFKALWIFPRVWLLKFDRAGYLTLPSEQMSEDVKSFLKQRIAAVGGKIK